MHLVRDLAELEIVVRIAQAVGRPSARPNSSAMSARKVLSCKLALVCAIRRLNLVELGRASERSRRGHRTIHAIHRFAAGCWVEPARFQAIQDGVSGFVRDDIERAAGEHLRGSWRDSWFGEEEFQGFEIATVEGVWGDAGAGKTLIASVLEALFHCHGATARRGPLREGQHLPHDGKRVDRIELPCVPGVSI